MLAQRLAPTGACVLRDPVARRQQSTIGLRSAGDMTSDGETWPPVGFETTLSSPRELKSGCG